MYKLFQNSSNILIYIVKINWFKNTGEQFNDTKNSTSYNNLVIIILHSDNKAYAKIINIARR